MRLALATLAFSFPVAASEYHALTGRVLKTYCQMGSCQWERVNSVSSIGENEIGELFEVRATTWEGSMERSSPKGLTPGKSTSYVFCSRSKPSILHASDSKWMVTEIAPGSPDTISHFNSAGVGEYWLICHGVLAHNLESIGSTLGRKLGYRANVSADSLNQRTIGRPEELLSR